MPPPKRDLFLIAGIPGTGKTTFGKTLAAQFGFVHSDLEDPPTLNCLAANSKKFIADMVSDNKDTVVTWGFVPDHQPSVSVVLEFKTAGFKLIWFDRNRPAALKRFQERTRAESKSDAEVYLRMPEFYLQMYKIEATKIIDTIKPAVIDSSDAKDEFKSPAVLLKELRQK
jgi:adenylate kinase family enzyme